MFDSVLRPETLPRRRLLSGGSLALVFYAGVAAFVLWASQRAMSTDRQDVAVTFVKPPPPPPPPPPPKAPTPQTKKVTVIRQAIVAPTVIPEEKPPETDPSNIGIAESDATSDISNQPGGIQGPVVDEKAAPPPRVEFDEKVMTQPAMVSGPAPEYTEKALEREVQGLIVVKCVLTVDGRVHDCRVIKSLPFMDRAVIDALEHRRYTPATLGGKPIEVDYTFRITLRLPS